MMADWSFPPQDAPLPVGPWWEAFGTPELTRLQEQAAAGNPDLAAAVARIAQAASQMDSADAALWPSLTASAGANRVPKKAGGADAGAGSARQDRRNTFQLGLSVAYEVDFWGGNRAAAVAAAAGHTASRYDHEVVARTLAADLSRAYFTVLALRDRLEIARSQLQAMQEILDVIAARETLGATSGLELAQQRSAVAQLRSTVQGLELQAAQAHTALALLLGSPPDRLRIQTPGLSAVTLPTYGAGIPSDLLHNRPDIRAAEARLIAADASIGVARAQLFPRLTLSAGGTASSTVIHTLLDPVSQAASLAAALSAPLFDGGRIRAGIDLAEARRAEVVSTYQKVVLAALGETQDALSALHFLANQRASQQEMEEQAAEAYRIATERYRAGAVDYQTLLETQRTTLQAQDSGVQLRLAYLHAAVDLARSVGGGA